MITRRTLVAGSAVVAAVAAIPFAAIAATPAAALVADMFYTEDEPWGAFVRGHVGKEQFDAAILRMIETDRDHRENGQDWLWEGSYDDDGEEEIRIITADPDHLYMRVDEVDDERGVLWQWCKMDDAGAIPITAVRY